MDHTMTQHDVTGSLTHASCLTCVAILTDSAQDCRGWRQRSDDVNACDQCDHPWQDHPYAIWSGLHPVGLPPVDIIQTLEERIQALEKRSAVWTVTQKDDTAYVTIPIAEGHVIVLHHNGTNITAQNLDPRHNDYTITLPP